MSEKHQRRAQVLNRVLSGSATKAEAERVLQLSRRQLNRVLRDYEAKGPRSLLHGNTGRTPVNKTPSESAARILNLAAEDGKYHDFNVCHMMEMLADNESIVVGRSTLDRLLRGNKLIGKKQSKKQVRRKRRERSSAAGMMLQIDGSLHDWLEGRGPKMALVGAIDDAVGDIVYATFRPTEDLDGYLLMLRSIARKRGLPESIYHDRHTILQSPKKPTVDEELAGIDPQSQFQRVLKELGVVSIAAHSPQAKGRVERLWGTLQDRLVKEMRLAGICSIEQANGFLLGFIRRYNKRFSQKPRDPQSAWVKLEPGTDLAYHFSTKESRVVRLDHTISWLGKTLEILPGSRPTCLAGKAVSVHITPEQELFLYYEKKRLQYRVVQSEARPKPLQQAKPQAVEPKPPDPAALARKRAWIYGKHNQADSDIMAEV